MGAITAGEWMGRGTRVGGRGRNSTITFLIGNIVNITARKTTIIFYSNLIHIPMQEVSSSKPTNTASNHGDSLATDARHLTLHTGKTKQTRKTTRYLRLEV